MDRQRTELLFLLFTRWIPTRSSAELIGVVPDVFFLYFLRFFTTYDTADQNLTNEPGKTN